jgi:hypothetical protein
MHKVSLATHTKKKKKEKGVRTEAPSSKIKKQTKTGN